MGPKKKTASSKGSLSPNLLELEVKTIVPGGDGLSFLDGIPVYVPFGVPGDLLKVRIVKKRHNFMVANIVEIKRPSDFRKKSDCPIFPDCGGCQWQMVEYEGQLKFKEELVREAFRKEKMGELPMEPIVGMENPWHYRNKVIYPVKRVRDGRILLGYYKKDTHKIIDLEECPVELKLFDPIVSGFKRLIEKEPITVYNEKKHRGKLRYLVMRGSERLDEVLVVLVMKLPATSRAMAEKIVALDPTHIVGVVENINPQRTNVIFGDRTKAITGRNYIMEEILGMRMRVSATSFFQVNTVQAEKLVKKLVGLAGERGYVIDAYSGVGLFSLAISKNAERVTGIEEAPSSYYDSLTNQEILGAYNVEFIHGKVEDHLAALDTPDLLIVDPPRKGLEDETLKAIIDKKPEEIAYVSCNPVTLARDSLELIKAGYKLIFLQPFDFMPHTYHVETLAYFRL